MTRRVLVAVLAVLLSLGIGVMAPQPAGAGENCDEGREMCLGDCALKPAPCSYPWVPPTPCTGVACHECGQLPSGAPDLCRINVGP
jgi:hypothetical protein